MRRVPCALIVNAIAEGPDSGDLLTGMSVDGLQPFSNLNDGARGGMGTNMELRSHT